MRKWRLVLNHLDISPASRKFFKSQLQGVDLSDAYAIHERIRDFMTVSIWVEDGVARRYQAERESGLLPRIPRSGPTKKRKSHASAGNA